MKAQGAIEQPSVATSVSPSAKSLAEPCSARRRLLGQAATEYLVTMGVVLMIALICVVVLFWPIETTKDAKKQQADVHFKIAAMEYPDLLQGLVAYYKFDEGSGTTASDSRGGVSGNLTGVPTWTTNAKSGYALEFDGASDYVNYGDLGIIDTAADNAMTVSFWIYPTDTSGTARWAVGKKVGVTSGYGWYVGYNSGTFQMNVRSAAATATKTAPVNLSRWTHIAAIIDRNSNLIRVYRDGSDIGTTDISAVTGTLSNTDNFRIGSTTGGLYFWNGTIDEVMIFNRALSAGEVLLLYENPGYPQ